jgi:ribosomal protein L37AE/L43A
MKIKQILSQERRDFTAIYECEHCGHTEKGYGYDDTHFNENVIPKMTCTKCGE